MNATCADDLIGKRGRVRSMARQGIALPAIMAMTDHRSVVSVIGYYNAGAAEVKPAARLLEGGPAGSARSTESDDGLDTQQREPA